MADSLTPKDWATLEELFLSCMWDTGAIIEVLEKKGILSKQELLDAIHDLRVKNPTALVPAGLTDSIESPNRTQKIYFLEGRGVGVPMLVGIHPPI